MVNPDLTGWVKVQAVATGFPLVGIASPERNRERAHYAEWLARGYHGSMDYLAKNEEVRFDPARLLEGVQSIIVVGLPYKTHDPVMVPDSAGAGLISNYAWGEDYHVVLKDRLEQLWNRIAVEYPAARARWFVDAVPLHERELAARAGLGWIGKHTLLINKQLGSYVFLGEILTDLPLIPDAPATAHCGTCTRCLEVCPTEAFPEAGVLDASKCISYLTIEHRGEIAPDLAAQMGSWVYGCDLCQAVCPWNQKAPSTLDPSFQPRPELMSSDLVSWAAMQQADYERLTRKSPLKRAKLAGLRRNAAIARRNGTAK